MSFTVSRRNVAVLRKTRLSKFGRASCLRADVRHPLFKIVLPLVERRSRSPAPNYSAKCFTKVCAETLLHSVSKNNHEVRSVQTTRRIGCDNIDGMNSPMSRLRCRGVSRSAIVDREKRRSRVDRNQSRPRLIRVKLDSRYKGLRETIRVLLLRPEMERPSVE